MLADSFDSFNESGRGNFAESPRGARGGVGIGDIVVGGFFTRIDGKSALSLAAFERATETWGVIGGGLNGLVFELAVFNDTLIMGGTFIANASNTITMLRIGQWDRNTFAPIDDGMDALVLGLAVFDGKLYAGGIFNTAGGTTVPKIASIENLTDAEWQPVGSSITPSNGEIETMIVYKGNLVIAGRFSAFNGTTADSIIEWDGNATVGNFGGGVKLGANFGRVRALAIDGDSLVAIGGFNDAGGVTVNNAAIWDGSSWSDMSNGLTLLATQATAEKFKDDILVGSNLTVADDVSIENFAIYDRAADSWSGLGTNPNAGVRDFLIASDGTLFTMGSFSTINGVSVFRIAQSTDTITFTPLGTVGPNGSIAAAVEYENAGAIPV